MKIEIDEEQARHLMDLLQLNSIDTKNNRIFTDEHIQESVKYDEDIIDIIDLVLNEN